MKTKNIIRICGVAMMSAMCLSSCDSILEEDPHGIYTPSYFKTKEGAESGITSLYAHLRNLYGNGYFLTSLEVGTDEYTYGHSADGNQKDIDMTGVGQITSQVCSNAYWNQAFTDINTASSVIEIATEVGLSDALIAEARFFRGMHYFNLVRTYGGVPIDLGSGILHSNDAPQRSSHRTTVDSVYTQAVFVDLDQAIKDLPDNPRLTGTVTKNVARLYLAKAYLTYAWWLENPNNIPTYPETTKQDKSLAADYYQKAYDMAMEAINNPGPYHLQATYRDVNLFENDRNAEWLLWADHTQKSEQYNGAGYGWGNGAAPENFAGWFTQWNYCGDMKAQQYKDDKPVFDDKNKPVLFNPVMREPIQGLGRPWTRMAPIPDALQKFTDTDKDSRWDASFATQYRVNMSKGGNKDPYAVAANGSHIKNGETFIKFLSADEKDANVTYATENGYINAGTMDGEPAFVIKVSDISRQSYPGLWKTIDTRTDRNMDTELGSQNAGSVRPYVIAKFSEFYFIAAEAAVKGAKTTAGNTARDLINVIRARAGKWTYSVGYNCAKVEDHSEELTAATPAEITIDYIMDERLREYFGEGYRWYDLVRTQTWEKFAGVYHIADGNGRQAVEKVRDIQKNFYLRPIPNTQIDAMIMTKQQKAAYQNPGY
jgi:hypothetical protein